MAKAVVTADEALTRLLYRLTDGADDDGVRVWAKLLLADDRDLIDPDKPLPPIEEYTSRREERLEQERQRREQWRKDDEENRKAREREALAAQQRERDELHAREREEEAAEEERNRQLAAAQLKKTVRKLTKRRKT